MKGEDKKKFLRGMEKLQISLPSSIRLTERQETLRINEFWEVLKDYSLEAFERAVERAKTELRFFPVPMDMIELCNEEEDHRRLEKESQYNPNQIELRHMTREEAMKAVLGIQEHLDRPGMNEEQIKADKEKVADRKAFLRAQAKLMNIEKPKGEA